jgi:hypothetical protein
MMRSSAQNPTKHASPLALWIVMLGGAVAGAASWALSHAITSVSEPFDDGIALVICQVTLALPALYAALRSGFLRSLAGLVCAWAGMNAYAYSFGSSEVRAWIVLLMFSSLTLLLIPAVAVTFGAIARAIFRKSHTTSTPAHNPHGND